jgi:predicted metal-dependent phosphoesterase TrpH
LIRADLHIHTIYSGDSKSRLEQIIARCNDVGINCIAVTDHNTIAGAVKVQQMAPFKVIVGEEIHTASGEVIGYFMTQEIPGRLPVAETVRRIKEQGGLVAVPHPFDRLRGSAIQRPALESILPDVDIIEVLNARSFLKHYNAMAERFAQKHGLVASAGSDAHTLGEIGRTYVEMPDFDSRDDFLKALAQGKIMGQVSPRIVHLKSTWAKLKGASNAG